MRGKMFTGMVTVDLEQMLAGDWDLCCVCCYLFFVVVVVVFFTKNAAKMKHLTFI